MNDKELLTQVFLLALWKKEPQETIEDVLNILISSNVMTPKEGNEVIVELKSKGAIVDGEISFVGIALAQEAQKRFAL